jgi:DNA (cytosine-5)-methyltransferase 1
MAEISDALFKIIDLFCGAGGFTSGVEDAEVNGKKVAEVVACINHDPLAIKSHAANHPSCEHYIEDIRIFDEKVLPRKSEITGYLWLHASLECTNFSNAKGGKPREADSRTLAWELNRYIVWSNPDIITIENVREFLAWGPLDDKGKPISRKNGVEFQRWKRSVEDLGYIYHQRFANSADFGAHTSRVRYFACFVKPGIPVVFPEPTHDKLGRHGLPKWRPVKDKLDFTNEGNSIFDVRTERTEKQAFKYLKGKHKGGNIKRFPRKGIVVKLPGVEQELLLKKHHRSFKAIIACFLAKHGKEMSDCRYSFHDEYSEKTLERIYQGLIKHVGNGKSDDAFILKWLGNNQHTGVNNGKPEHKNISVDGPAATIKCVDNQALVMAYYSSGLNVTSVDYPAPTIRTHDGLAVFMMKYYSGGGQIGDVESEPAPVIIARQDKKPLGMITVEGGDEAPVIILYDSDTKAMRKIKIFMAMHGIVDIRMRMLTVFELKTITGFKDDYYLAGPEDAQKKFIGNAVPPVYPQRWVEAYAEHFINNQL